VKVRKELSVQLVPPVLLVQLVLKVRKEQQVLPGLLVLKALKVILVLKDQLGQLVHKVLLV